MSMCICICIHISTTQLKKKNNNQKTHIDCCDVPYMEHLGSISHVGLSLRLYNLVFLKMGRGTFFYTK